MPPEKSGVLLTHAGRRDAEWEKGTLVDGEGNGGNGRTGSIHKPDVCRADSEGCPLNATGCPLKLRETVEESVSLSFHPADVLLWMRVCCSALDTWLPRNHTQDVSSMWLPCVKTSLTELSFKCQCPLNVNFDRSFAPIAKTINV